MNWRKWLLFGMIDVVLVCGAVYYYFVVFLGAAPAQTDLSQEPFVVEAGERSASVFTRLETDNLVQSQITLRILFGLHYDSTEIKAGTYNLHNKTAQQIADLLVAGQFDADLVSVTFLEGERVSEYGKQANASLSNFDLERFTELTTDAEGTLFPDTYFVPDDYSADDLFELLRDQHDQVIAEVFQTASEVEIYNQIILASILEREANDKESMRTVAGIFQNRIDIGMALQADASIEYVIDTPLGELPPGQLAAELRELDSPYNTYLNPGLPPTPIGNPGRQALEAIANPIQSDYLFYITGDDGEFYYATSYNEHLTNIERHL